MALDGLPEQFEEFVGRARSALDREIVAAKNVVAAANAEKSSAQSALANLQAQCKLVSDQLEVATRELQRVAVLAGVGHDLEKAHTELNRVKSETAEASKALERLAQERTAREAQLNALNGEVQRLVAIRTESEGVMAHIKMQLNSVQIGQRP
jgi:chromosome segregation ATPase